MYIQWIHLYILDKEENGIQEWQTIKKDREREKLQKNFHKHKKFELKPHQSE